jgi:hypothetical protein
MRSEAKPTPPKSRRATKPLSQSRKPSRDADHEYFTRNFPSLVRKHGGKWIVLVQGHLVGISHKGKLAGLIAKARSQYPAGTPFIAPIPTRDEIECVL